MDIDLHKKADDLFDQVRNDFINHLNLASKRLEDDSYNPTRIGLLDEKSTKATRENKRVDHRPIEMMSISGKGSREYPDSINVSLFDHSLDVGCGAARLAAHDLIPSVVKDDDLLRVLAMLMVIGFCHDVDKKYGIHWNSVSVKHVKEFMDAWLLADFLKNYGVDLTAEHLLTYVSAVEVRSSATSVASGANNRYIALARRYARIADGLAGKYLKSHLDNGAEVLKGWASMKGQLENPTAFDDYELLTITDVHNPFLMNEFQQMLHGSCVEIAGVPPLFCSLMDGTLTTYLPSAHKEEIIDMAVESLKWQLPLDTEVIVSGQGAIKMTGPAPTAAGLYNLMQKSLLDSGGNKIFAIKTVDFADNTKDGGVNKSMRLPDLVQVALAANCPTLEKLMPGALTYIVAKQQMDSPSLASAVKAASVVFLAGVQQTSKDKNLVPHKRLERLIEMFSLVVPEWFEEADILTRRTYVGLSVAAAIRNDPCLQVRLDNWAKEMLAEDGLFNGYKDKANDVSRAVVEHYRAAAKGVFQEAQEGDYRCVVTGMPVSNEWKIEKADKLHNIKSSAISYREGRSEHKFRERADAHISPIAFAEYRLRSKKENAKIAKYGGIPSKDVPVSLMSPVNFGFFGSQYMKSNLGTEDFGLFDIARFDKKGGKLTIDPISLYDISARIGRFENVGNSFVDQIDFFKRAIESAIRLGRPIHIFSGLPHLVPDFFYADCLGRNLESLLGNSGLRIEELKPALNKLNILLYLATSPKDGGLGQVELAKAFCYPAQRFHAAILAWLLAIRSETPKQSIVNVLFNDIIPEELRKMANIPPEVKLAKLARGVQRAVLSTDSNNTQEFIIRTAFEEAEKLYANGRRTAEELIGPITEIIYREAQRKHNSSGFFSGKHTRPEGVSVEDQLRKVVEVFVNDVWFGLLNGRPCKHAYKRQIFAAYLYGFKNAEISETPSN